MHSSRAVLSKQMLLASLVLGLVGDSLLRAHPWGLNVCVWATFVVIAALILAVLNRIDVTSEARWLAGLAVAFAWWFTWRDSSVLQGLNLLAVLSACAVATLGTDGCLIRRAALTDYLYVHLLSGIQAAAGLTRTLTSEIRWTDGARHPALRSARASAVGFALAVPLLLVFGKLLMAADAVLERLVIHNLAFDVETLLSHVLLSGALAWVVGGLLRRALLPPRYQFNDITLPAKPRLGLIEIGLPLGTLNLLFLLFVLIQMRYLFGDHSLVESTTGLTYSEYARRGFFELVTVAGLALPLLLLADWALPDNDLRLNRFFRALATMQLGLLALIMASAVQRMLLYVSAYGLTELRLYATAFMAWLGASLLWFSYTVLRGRREHFAFGALVAGFMTLASLNLLNPDGFIVRVNAARARADQAFDVAYATSLGGDAALALLEALPDLSPHDRCGVASYLLERWAPPSERDWRSWNRARAAAWNAVGGSAANLNALICPSEVDVHGGGNAEVRESVPQIPGVPDGDDSPGSAGGGEAGTSRSLVSPPSLRMK